MSNGQEWRYDYQDLPVCKIFLKAIIQHCTAWYMNKGLCLTVNLCHMLLKVLHVTTWSNSLEVFCASTCFVLPPEGFSQCE
jgi:hypothetical protein